MPGGKHIAIQLDGLAKDFGAEVYSESPRFLCLLSINVHQSVVGKGASVAEAVNNWDTKLEAHLRNAKDDDPVVVFVRSHLVKKAFTKPSNAGLGRRNVTTYREDNKPQHVINFENQFYPKRRKD
ncbi:hypothetical protein [Pedobacter mucosus]|uniref:hypothetical protein n=1 Tax=Pedobacter mucosus TaxID=2895286 RepID=UPI001EE4DE06|nr:hypothetical protein [Pedobacter mucosus]UKT66020.1 hypothetical protein LOK61_09555 [Pedobacter mucosus]